MRATTATAANSGRHKRPRGREQMDLFDSVRLKADGAPLWPDLPERARSALTELMARLILAHAAKVIPLPAKEAGDDL
jgi:delta 1-pyrroline-5-carboxylate dehydrogenase